MNKLQVFEHFRFGSIRTTIMNGAIWFAAIDICQALEIKNHRDALLRLDADEKGVGLTDSSTGEKTISIVNEEGLYTLVLSSRKREAKEFKRWVTHEVIPTIRKTGSYSIAGANQPPAINAADVQTIAKMVAKELKSQQEKQVKALLPKGNAIYVSTTDYEALQYIRETVHWMERLERREFYSVVRDFVRALVL